MNRSVAALFFLSLTASWVAGPSQANAEPSDVAAQIDARLQAVWKEHQISPAPAADDGTFLRRVHLDLVGKLPEVDRVRAFLDDKDPQKRRRVVDELLASPDYAKHWANYWDAVLMGRLTREAFIDRNAFRTWIEQQFRENTPWDKFVSNLITAEGYNTNRQPRGGTENPSDMAERFNPATNWFLRYFRSLPELSGAASKTFLGLKIQCAQCHNHPTESWKQDDFRQFTAFFTKTWPVYIDRTLTVGTVRMETKDRLTVPPTTGRAADYYGSYADFIRLTPKDLQGHELSVFSNRRGALAKWMTSSDNPWFATAIVNRLWGRLLGVGFIEPIDDIRPTNPATEPELLKLLAEDFVRQEFDLKHLLRTICLTQAYQLSAQKPENSLQQAYWSYFPLKSLDIEVLYDSTVQATGAEQYLQRASKDKSELVRQAFIRQFVTQMSTDDMAEIAEDETISRALQQLNGAFLSGTIRSVPGLALHDILQREPDGSRRIEALYLRSLCRRPTKDETDAWLTFLKTPRQVAKTDGPPVRVVTGLAALRMSPEMSAAGESADFRELVKHARTAVDFRELATRMRNNADAALFAKAFEAWAATIPFEYLSTTVGARTAADQAYEDIFWALLNSSEFLTNH